MTKPEKHTIRAWTRLVRAHNMARGAIDQALKGAGLPPLEWYDILLELERAGRDGLRPFKLQRQLLLPQYAISRLLDRLADAGLIDCRSCNEDGRGQVAILTDEGKKMRARMWPVYGDAMQDAIGRHLSTQEAEQLGNLLENIAER
jgi:DNA-binding MarR family transcriptional regulator